jgi:hypothetical protein
MEIQAHFDKTRKCPDKSSGHSLSQSHCAALATFEDAAA